MSKWNALKRRYKVLIAVGVLWMAAMVAPAQVGYGAGWLIGSAVIYWPVTVGAVVLATGLTRRSRRRRRSATPNSTQSPAAETTA
jgi:hypothetical protein